MDKSSKTTAKNCHNGMVVNLRLTHSQQVDLRQIKACLANVLGKKLTDTLILRRALARYHHTASQMALDGLREEAKIIASKYR